MTAAELGRVGLWTFQLDLQPAARAQEAARELEGLGYRALWIPEAVGREAFTNAGLLLAGTERLVVATGIANVWARDAMAMAAAQKTLDEAYPGRFLLGIGVSHKPMVDDLRGHRYRKPLTYMRDYLDAMDRAFYVAPAPSVPGTRVIGALHPKMLRLAAERTAGAHPYFVTPEHTARARAILGPGPLRAPEPAVVLDSDPAAARAAARAHMALYLTLPNYRRNLVGLGFGDDDFAAGASDRLVDAIVAWGGVEAVVARVQAHLAAGADHVCVQVLDPDPAALPMRQWRELAPALCAI
jgi:probable F420-dependent oxidoreductase